MKKEFIPFSIVKENSIKLAYTIHKTGFIPDVIYVCLRGGAYIGNIISEYFKLIRKKENPPFYAAVVARSYFDSSKQGNVVVDGWTYNPEYLRYGEKILFIDDIFDSGYTINHLIGIIIKKGIQKKDVKIAVHDYKKRLYKKNTLPIKPDFFCRLHKIKKAEDDIWFHYLSHELVGFSKKDLKKYFHDPDDQLINALNIIKDNLP